MKKTCVKTFAARVDSSHFFIKYLHICLAVFLFSSIVTGNTIHVPADYATIQQAINAAINGDTIIVSPGTYYENINFNGKNIILTSTDQENPNVVASTIIDGGQNGSVVTFSGNETSACELRGFTITDGNATFYTNGGRGGGINGYYTHATIANCIIIGNTADYDGGGLFNCWGTISDCSIVDNTAGQKGGGLAFCGTIRNCEIIGNASQGEGESGGGGLAYCYGEITNCVISDNMAAESGGGLYICYGSIIGCMIIGNTADYSGGGIAYCDGPIKNCIIAGNTANHFGGGVIGVNTIVNCTIVSNSATEGGGGLYYFQGAEIANCIIWGNSGQSYNDSTPTFSCLQNWSGGGTGNISSDPLFYDPAFDTPANWDFHLLIGSPCVDTGNNTPPGGLPDKDIEGNSRPFDGDYNCHAVADMGAYEMSIDPNVQDIFSYAAPRYFYFSAPESDVNPYSEMLKISNLGSREIDWSMDLIGKPGWLTISPASGSLAPNESQDVILSVDITGLSHGQYSYSFEVSDAVTQNSPQTVIVELSVKNILYVDGSNSANPNSTGSKENPFGTIQKGIDAASDGDKVIVMPGTYYENINFKGTDIVLTSTNLNGPESTIIDGNHYGRVVTFSGGESPSCILRGFTIRNGDMGGYPWRNGWWPPEGAGIHGWGTQATISNCLITDNYTEGYLNFENYLYAKGGGLYNCDGTIVNCTITNNWADYGGGLYDCDGLIINCIIWNNFANIGAQLNNSSTPVYSCIQNWTGGTGNINSDPLFSNTSNGDYHLKSQYGRWRTGVDEYTYLDRNNTPSDPNDDFWVIVPGTDSQWVYDPNISPCIDTGDPASDWREELWPHGGRINMGAYGGTPQASMSANPAGNIADLNHDDAVDLDDLALFCQGWLHIEYLLDTDLNRNGAVDISDFAVFADQWLWLQPTILCPNER